MRPTRYPESEAQDEMGPLCFGAADLWEEGSSSVLSHGSFFPSLWSPKTKEVLDGATTLKLPDARKLIMADVKRRERPNGSGYYNFYCQPK